MPVNISMNIIVVINPIFKKQVSSEIIYFLIPLIIKNRERKKSTLKKIIKNISLFQLLYINF